MAQHKWHKEIKAWADGAEIECKYHGEDEWNKINKKVAPTFAERHEYRIKPQPKKPQYLYVYMNRTVAPHNYLLRTSIQEDGIYIGKIKLEQE